MSLDVSQLPDEIRAYIQAEILRASTPPEPPQKTVGEKLSDALAEVAVAMNAERTLPTGSGRIHQAVLQALLTLRDYVDNHTHTNTTVEESN